ncbi:MAG: histidine kinase [Pyrinomonadaceae bacterium]
MTTIGYLITASPERALRTLLKLTELLRRVLKVTGEFVTLGEELKVVESYLDIERERFEERLHVVINVPPGLLEIRVPPLIVQPLVENAIKHGIAPSRMGGTVEVVARLSSEPGQSAVAAATLIITVRNTGVGVSESELIKGRRRGVGVEQHRGAAAPHLRPHGFAGDHERAGQRCDRAHQRSCLAWRPVPDQRRGIICKNGRVKLAGCDCVSPAGLRFARRIHKLSPMPSRTYTTRRSE